VLSLNTLHSSRYTTYNKTNEFENVGIRG